MSAIEGKYGRITAEKKQFHEDEPVFLLRATDPLAPVAVHYYALMCKDVSCTSEHTEAAFAHADRIRSWQHEHPELVKNCRINQ